MPRLEIGCGTGVHAATVRALGRTPVGASHWPLPALLNAFLDAGLPLEHFAEGGTPVPIVLGVRARKRAD